MKMLIVSCWYKEQNSFKKFDNCSMTNFKNRLSKLATKWSLLGALLFLLAMQGAVQAATVNFVLNMSPADCTSGNVLTNIAPKTDQEFCYRTSIENSLGTSTAGAKIKLALSTLGYGADSRYYRYPGAPVTCHTATSPSALCNSVTYSSPSTTTGEIEITLPAIATNQKIEFLTRLKAPARTSVNGVNYAPTYAVTGFTLTAADTNPNSISFPSVNTSVAAAYPRLITTLAEISGFGGVVLNTSTSGSTVAGSAITAGALTKYYRLTIQNTGTGSVGVHSADFTRVYTRNISNNVGGLVLNLNGSPTCVASNGASCPVLPPTYIVPSNTVMTTTDDDSYWSDNGNQSVVGHFTYGTSATGTTMANFPQGGMVVYEWALTAALPSCTNTSQPTGTLVNGAYFDAANTPALGEISFYDGPASTSQVDVVGRAFSHSVDVSMRPACPDLSVTASISNDPTDALNKKIVITYTNNNSTQVVSDIPITIELVPTNSALGAGYTVTKALTCSATNSAVCPSSYPANFNGSINTTTSIASTPFRTLNNTGVLTNIVSSPPASTFVLGYGNNSKPAFNATSGLADIARIVSMPPGSTVTIEFDIRLNIPRCSASAVSGDIGVETAIINPNWQEENSTTRGNNSASASINAASGTTCENLEVSQSILDTSNNVINSPNTSIPFNVNGTKFRYKVTVRNTDTTRTITNFRFSDVLTVGGGAVGALSGMAVATEYVGCTASASSVCPSFASFPLTKSSSNLAMTNTSCIPSLALTPAIASTPCHSTTMTGFSTANDIQATLAPGGSLDFIWETTASLTSSQTATCTAGNYIFTNTAKVRLTEDLNEPITTDNTAQRAITFVCHDLLVVKVLQTNGQTVFQHGDPISFGITVNNGSDGTATQIPLIDQLPANIIPSTGTITVTCAPATGNTVSQVADCPNSAGWTNNITHYSSTIPITGANAGILNATIQSLPKDGSLYFVVTSSVNINGGIGNSTNTASVDLSTANNKFDPSLANNSALANYTVVDPNQLLINKQSDVTTKKPDANRRVKYTISVMNPTANAFSGVTIHDVLPSGFEFDSSTAPVISLINSATNTNSLIPSNGDTTLVFGTYNIPAVSGNIQSGVIIEFTAFVTNSAECGVRSNSIDVKTNAGTVTIGSFNGVSAGQANDDVTIACEAKLTKTFSKVALVPNDYTTPNNTKLTHGINVQTGIIVRQGEIFKLTFAFSVPAGALASNNATISDNLPAHIVVAPNPNIGGTCSNASTATLASGLGTAVTISGVSLPSGGTSGSVCTVSIDVVTKLDVTGNSTANACSTNPVNYTNTGSTAGNIAFLQGNIQDGIEASCVITTPAPLMTKGFTASTSAANANLNASTTILSGNSANLRIRIINPAYNANGVIGLPAVTGISFTDTLPTNWKISGTVMSTGCGSPAIIAPLNGNSISVTSASVASSTANPTTTIQQFCYFDIPVTNQANLTNSSCPTTSPPAAWTNTFRASTVTTGTQNLTTTPDTTGNNAVKVVAVNACLLVNEKPTLTKAFAPTIIDFDQTSTLTFSLTNPSGNLAVTGIGFTDTLPSGVQLASGATATVTGCTATTVVNTNNPPITASTLVVSALTLPDATAGDQVCTISVPVSPLPVSANTYNPMGCSTSAPNFTNGSSNISGIANLTNDVTSQCLTVNPPPKIAVAKLSGTPTRTGSGTFDITYTYTINNYSLVTTENITATNVQLVDNFTRTYTDGTVPTITLKSLSITTAPGVGSTCTKAAAYSAAIPVAGITVSGSTALLAGTDSLLPTHTCVVTASITVDYGTAAMPTMAATCSVSGTPPVPSAHTTTVSQLGCNTAVVSTVRGTSPVNAGATIPDNPITSIASTTYPPNTTASDYSNHGIAVDTSTAAQNTATPTLAIPSWYASVSKSFSPSTISSNLPVSVVFTITNTPGNPAQTGLGLVDTLGASLKWTSASPSVSYSAGCSGPATAAASAVASTELNTLTISAAPGIAMTSGTASCTVTVNGMTNAVAGATNATCPNAGFSNASITPTNLVVSGAMPCLAVTPAIVLGLTKSAPSVPLQEGVATNYTLTVTNAIGSPNATNGATVQEQIPTGLNYNSFSGTGWSCSSATVAGQVTLTCTYSLAINGGANSNPLDINVTPLTGSRGTTVTNKASVDVNGGTAPNAASLCTANGTPTGCAINTSDVKTIDVVKSVGTVVQVNATTFDVPYTLTVGNKALSTGAIATNFQVVENLFTTFSSGSPTLTWPSFAAQPSVTEFGGATPTQCELNTVFVSSLTTTGTNVFSGMQNLSGGQGCTVNFVVRVAYTNTTLVPTSAQNNSVIASVYSSAPATAGANNTSTVLTSDTSSNVTNANAAILSLPNTMNGDSPAVTPVTFAGQNIGVTKSVGTPVVVSSTPLQVVFDIPYSLRVKNTGSATATNVQVIDRLHGTGGTYASANTVVVQGTPTISSPTAAAGCTLAATPYTAGLFTGMPGNTSLAAGDMCIINFTARVTFNQSATDIDDSRNLVPSTNSNTAYASTATSLNVGGDVNAGGFVAPVNGVVNDASSSVATSCVSNVAANPLCDPTTSDTPSVTTVNLIAPALGTAKRIVSNTQIGPRKYALVFELAVQNTGNVTAYNVRLQDNLADVFGSNAVLSAVSTSSLTGAVCTANASYTGKGSATDVVNSIASLPVNSMCKARMNVTVDYGTNAVPTSAVNNQAYATSVPSATDVNNGYTFVSGVPVLGNGCASGVTPCTVALTADASDAGTSPNTNNATATGASSGNAASTYNDPTPIVFTTQRLDVSKSAGTPSVTASTPLAVTFSIPYSIFIKNTGSVIANNVQLVDKLAGTGGTYAGASTVSVSNIAMGGSTGCTSIPTYDSNTGVLTAFAGNTQLPVGAVCIVNFTVSATYNQSAAGVDDARSTVPSTARNNSAYASTANSSNSGGTFNATTGVYVEPVDVIASDVSTSIAASCLATASNVLPTGACEPNSTSTPSATPTVLIAPAIGSAKTAISVTQTGIKQFDTKYEIKLANTGNTPIYNVRLQDNLAETFDGAAVTILNTPNLNAPTVTQGTCTLNTSFDGQTNTDVLSGGDTLLVGATCTVNFTVRANFGSNAVPSSVNNQSFASGVLNSTDVNAGYVFGGAVPTSTAAVTDKSDSGTIANSNNPLATGASASNGPTSFDDPTPSTLESQTVRVTKAKTGTITLETITGGVQLKVPMKVVVKNVGTVVATNVQVVDSLSAAFPAPATTISLATRTSGAVVDVSLGGTTPALACTVNTSPYNSATGLLTFMSGSTNLAAGQSCIYDFDVLVVYPNAQSIPSSGLANTAFASSATVANSGGTVTAPATLGAVPSYSPITEVVAVAVSADKSSCASNCDPAITDTALPTPLSFTYPKLGLSKAKTGYEQVGVSEYRMTYRLNLKNNGNVIATNVQLNDYLPHAYPSPATFSNINITAVGCTKNNAYNGLTDSALLSGTTSLAVNATCIVTLQFNVNYPTVNDVPLSSVILKNSAYGSSLATANTVGYTFTGTAAAAPTATAPASAMSTAMSDSGTDPDSSNDLAPGATNGVNKYQDPTPHSFIPLNTVTGKVFLDLNGDRIAGTGEKPKGCYLVQIYDASVNPAVLIPFLSAVTNSNGEYSIPGVGSGQYELRFKAVQGTANNCPTLAQVLANQALISANATGVGQNGTTQTQGSTNNIATAPNTPSGIIPLQIAAGSSGILVVDQNLPIDPSGIIYNSVTRLPIAGAIVTLQNGSCSGPVISSADLNGGSNPITTAADGLYAFNFTNAAAITANQNPVICVSHATYNMSTLIPATNGYSTPFLVPPATPTPTTPLLVQANAGPPTGSQATTYYLAFNYQNPTEILHNHIPMDSIAPPTLSVVKTGNKKVVTIGETLSYSLEVKLQNAIAAGLPNVELIDRLPVGFTLIKDTVRVQFNASPATAPTITQNSTGLHIPIGTLLNTDVVKVTYTVRVGAGAQLSDGINRAQLSADFNSQTITSLVAAYKVTINEGVFTSQACIVGKVFVDCNFNSIQDKEEPGIPGVRLYMEDSTYFVTDRDGKFSYCGVSPTSHIVKVDPTTLPARSRLVTSRNRNLGDANSLLLDVRSGELVRADFIEGSCTPSLLKEVEARKGKEDSATQILVPKNEGVPDVHKTLEGMVLPKSPVNSVQMNRGAK